MGPKAYEELCDKLCSHIDKVLEEKYASQSPSDFANLEKSFNERFDHLSSELLAYRKENQELRDENERHRAANDELESRKRDLEKTIEQLHEQNTELKQGLRSRSSSFDDSATVTSRDDVAEVDDVDDICRLNETADSIDEKCHSDEDESDVSDVSEEVRNKWREMEISRKQGRMNYDILILSDSMMRHVGGISPKVVEPKTARSKLLADYVKSQPRTRPKRAIHTEFEIHGLSVLRVVVPGARVADLWVEANIVSQDYDFGLVIAHVGINYFPITTRKGCSLLHREDAEKEIISFLSGLAGQFTGTIAYSAVLPTRDVTFIGAISAMNEAVSDHCQARGFGVMYVHEFTRNLGGLISPTMFTRDGVHFNAAGIDHLEKAVSDFAIENFMNRHTLHGSF